MMVEVTKNLEKRYQALKWMYQQGVNGFVRKDITSKFHVPTNFVTATVRKSLVKSSGMNGSKYIGGEPTIKLAAEVFDYERQLSGKYLAKYPKKMIDVEGLDKFKDVVEKATKTQVSVTEDKHILPTVQIESKPTVPKKESSIVVLIKGNDVSMSWDDFSQIMSKINGNRS